MDGIIAPRDAGLRNIIDKLAEFVARNGPEFEMITKQKQQGNPKFEFLYGGEYATYYQHRVNTEIGYLKQQNLMSAQHLPAQQQQLHMHHQPPPQQQQVPTHFGMQQMPHQNPFAQQPTNVHDNHAYGMNQQPPNQMWPGSSVAPTAPPQQAAVGNSMAINSQIENINVQQNVLREQIRQSESNLTAQHSALMSQQAKQIEDAIEAAQSMQLEQQAKEHGIQLQEFDVILQPIIESCTKDSISAVASSDQRSKLTKLLALWESKAKFFDACVISKLQSPDSSMQEYKTNLQNLHHDIVTKFADATKSTMENYKKQHHIFIQHATQQITQLEQQKQQLEQQILAAVLPTNTTIMPPNTAVLPPATQMQQQQQQQQHLQQQQQKQQTPHKIPSLMSQKISMPDDLETTDHMKPPGVDDTFSDAAGNYQNDANRNNAGAFGSNNNNNNMLYQQQATSKNPNNPFKIKQPPAHHNPFATDVMPATTAAAAAQNNFFIPDLSKPPPSFMSGAQQQQQQQLPAALQQQLAQLNNIPNNLAVEQNLRTDVAVDINALSTALQFVQQHQLKQQLQQQQQTQNQAQQLFPVNLTEEQQQLLAIELQKQQLQQQLQQQQQQPQQQPDAAADTQHNIAEDDEEVPPPPSMNLEPQKPTAPYYDLPAGLMVPLILLEDCNYKPLDPEDIRLPPPQPQDERLTNALTAFFLPPTHDRPRDTEGWEKLGLYEYYKVKNAAKKQKEDEIANGIRQKSRSLSPIVLERPKPKKVSKRCYRSKSRSRSRSRSPQRSSPPPTQSRSSPPAARSRETRESGRDGSRRNRFRQRSRTPPPKERERSNSERSVTAEEAAASSNNSRDNRSNERSTTNSTEQSTLSAVPPPSFLPNNVGNFAKTNEFIGETNKGHQMLMKMGWAGTGTGLGTKSQGIDQPISGGEVRDKNNMYKGVGINMNDPFENFRKNKGNAFIHRMRSRDDKAESSILSQN